MPLIQKIVRVGGSRAVVIPHSWLKYYEERNGEISEVELETKGDTIIIKPHILPKP
jgi:antitoxin component of MazEF toxin-antitoxin module